MMNYEEWMRSENVGAGYFSDYLEYYKKRQEWMSLKEEEFKLTYPPIYTFSGKERELSIRSLPTWPRVFMEYEYNNTNKQINNKLLLLL